MAIRIPLLTAQRIAEIPPPPPTAPIIPVLVDRPLPRPRRSRSPALAGVIRSLLYLGSTVGVMYAAHAFVQHRLRLIEEAAKPQASPPPPMEAAQPPARENIIARKETPTNAIAVEEVPEKKPDEPRPEAITAPEVVLAPLPSHLTLPEVTDQSIASLVALPDRATLSLVTESSGLTLDDERIKWADDESAEPNTIAGLAYRNDSMQFRWVGEVPEEAEDAVRNSLVKVERHGQPSFVALRSPDIGEAFSFNLEKSKLLLVCKCQHMPTIRDIRFGLLDHEKLPPFDMEGDSIEALELRQTSVLRYKEVAGVKTTVEMARRGNALVAEFTSLFMLPSGDIESLSISAGTKKQKELERLISSAQSAKSQRAAIQRHIGTLNAELARWKAMRTTSTLNGVQVPNTALAGQKATGIANTQNAIAYEESRLAKANQLTADLPAMQQELEALKNIARLAEKLHNTTNLGYRFFIVVGGHEVNLLIGSSTSNN